MPVSASLDPTQLTPAASVNRVRFTELPGLGLPADMLERTAYELLSARALADLTAQLGSESAARQYGERLGWLAATLRRGDEASRAARSDWDDSYWRHWAGIRTFVLGGGIVGGPLGESVAEHATRTLAGVGMQGCRVRVAPWPELLPLVGAARLAADAATMIVLDFGGSFVKRACARYDDGRLSGLRIFSRRPTKWTTFRARSEPTAEEVRRLAAYMVETIAETWWEAQTREQNLSPTIVASLASYVRDGQPIARQGGAYSYLLALSENLADWLAGQLTSALGRQMVLKLLHDGTAAAHALAGEERSAVIMLGTALGVGFPPAGGAVRPLGSRFTVSIAEDEP